jgi:hypothetical protein
MHQHLNSIFENIPNIANYNNNCKHVKVCRRQIHCHLALIFGAKAILRVNYMYAKFCNLKIN